MEHLVTTLLTIVGTGMALTTALVWVHIALSSRDVWLALATSPMLIPAACILMLLVVGV